MTAVALFLALSAFSLLYAARYILWPRPLPRVRPRWPSDRTILATAFLVAVLGPVLAFPERAWRVVRWLLLLVGLASCSASEPCTGPGNGCGIGPTAYVTIDTAFSPDERAAIVAGLRAWEQADPRISFAVGDGPGLAFLRVGPDRYCPASGTVLDPDVLGRTTLGHGSAVVCIALPFPCACSLTKTAEHETGHAFGLVHEDAEPSIMATCAEDEAPGPMPADVARLAF